MKLSSPFAKKKKPSKAVTNRNSKAKKSKPKAKKVLAYFGMVAVLFITTVSYGGYALYQRETLKAEAGGWTYLTNSGDARIKWARACKKYVNAYGGLWKVDFQVYRNDVTAQGIKIIVLRGQSESNRSYNNQWLYGVVNGTSVYSSIYHNEVVTFQINFSNSKGSKIWYMPGSNSAYDNPAKLANC